jgi:diaminohydroxyphosphoribosylaminopyrimidine deaminase/5-amino-6-(5-phosphoribosylamino)uracil reductase
VKLALSLDARLAEAPGRRTDLTGPAARREVHRLRAGHDAVLVGGTTARVDDPLLTVREDVPLRRQPVRMILDGRAAMSSEAALFRDADLAPVWVFVRDSTSEAELERLEAAGAVVHPVPAGPGGVGVDLDAVLAIAWTAGVRAIFCEGGGRVAASFLASGLAQRLYVLLAPRLLGPDAVPAFPEVGAANTSWSLAEPPRAFGDDTLLVLDRPNLVGIPDPGAV